MGERAVIVGAAGRDFHNFNLFFRDNPVFDVVAFTAAQIPDIDGRVYPAELAGMLYPEGIPIVAEEELSDLIRRKRVRFVVFAYSDVPYDHVMHLSSIANAAGASFLLLGTESTWVRASVPVVSVCAVRTGCGKSQTTRAVIKLLKSMGRRTVVIRHPMPYGDLRRQRVQRFASYDDLDQHACTIEEREEYEPHIDAGSIVYAGVDYQAIVEDASREADAIVWDGGNNDLPFVRPDLHIVVVDPHRPGHELRYYPGEANLRLADVAVINKMDTADEEGIRQVRQNIERLAPKAVVIEADSPITVENPEALRGKRVLVVEDGPTLTHGEMKYGAGTVAARKFGAAEIIDPRPYAVGTIAETYRKYPGIGALLPAMGYGEGQIADLEATINRVPCDLVVSGTPIDLGRVLESTRPMVRVFYELKERPGSSLESVVRDFAARHPKE